ncbi:Beta-Amyrin Synthase 1 [Vitis vinifera]|uniref:Beta-Amyrin Synthase 1 n=1 Tax=Vitis vinifera TaxID=29760 RepID=A0A438HZN7_VITVI
MLYLSAYLMRQFPLLLASTGGVAVWEPAGAEEWLEKLNPSELFTNIVIEHEYVECTSSAIQTLLLFKKLYPNHRRKEVDNFIEKETSYVEDVQGRMDLGMHLFRFWLLS